MRKVSFVLIVIFTAFFMLSGSQLKLLEIKEPTGGKGKNTLLVNLTHVEAILKDFQLEKISGAVELANQNMEIVATLGKVKKGNLKWSHKTVEGHYLQVKFKKNHYPAVKEKVLANALNPGLRLQVSETSSKISGDKMQQKYFKSVTVEKQKMTLKWKEITLVEKPDLAVLLKYPVNVAPDAELSKEITITVENRGTGTAENFNVNLVLSEDNNISMKPAAPSDQFTDDMLMPNGSQTLASLEPGESRTLALTAPVTLPKNITPNRYYLGAVIDPENKLEEMDENNNVYSGFFLVNTPPPDYFSLDMCTTRLVYNPQTYALQVFCGQTMISDGRDWRKCKIRPYVHQLKHVSWPDYHWEINTIEKGVYQVKGAKFCKTGGKTDKELKIKMDVKGGSKTATPSQICLNMTGTRLTFQPKAGKLSIISHDSPIAHLPFWRVFKMQNHVYQIQNSALWQDFFWEVDTYNKVTNKITGGKFSKEDTGTPTQLPIKLKVE